MVGYASGVVCAATSATSAAWSTRYGFLTPVAQGNRTDAVLALWTRNYDS